MANNMRFACKYLLPLNREERFYSATILPMLLVGHNFEALGNILERYDFPKPDECDLFQFFTEYSSYKSSHAKDVKMNGIQVERDTPDVVCVMKKGSNVYVLILEVKMFDKRVRAANLNSQMEKQVKVIGTMLSREMEKNAHIKAVAVLPQKLRASLGGMVESVSFEEVLKMTPKTPENEYFWMALDYALKVYGRKVSK